MYMVQNKGVFRQSDMRDVKEDSYKETIDFESGGGY